VPACGETPCAPPIGASISTIRRHHAAAPGHLDRLHTGRAKSTLSERQLERRFLLRVGMMPKRFARLARFERAVSLMDSASALAAVAQLAGYYDQSHFVREFRAFAGTAPAAWRGRR